MRSVSRGKTWEGRCGFGRGSKNQRQERIRSWQTAVGINHTSVLAKADFFHTCEYIHIQLANSNIVKTSDLFRKEDLAEVESEVGVKYWIRGTTGETGFHSILVASFYPAEDPGRIPAGSLIQISSPASRERSRQVSRGNFGGNLRKYQRAQKFIEWHQQKRWCSVKTEQLVRILTARPLRNY